MLTLAVVGCGGMGRRHLRGLRRLREIGAQRFRLVAAVDVSAENAASFAQLAEELLNERPRVLPSLSAMAGTIGAVDAVIITTMVDSHARIGIEAFALGAHVMVEKPIALTVSQGMSLVAAAEASSRKLAVAENYRRDPINRLAKALIDAGALGKIHLMVQSSSGSGERVIITPWRHRRATGGIIIDMGIHYTDLLEYLAGPIRSVFGMNAIVDRRRVDAAGEWHEADAEDLSAGIVRFDSGAIGHYLLDCAGRGAGHFSRVVYGANGSLSIPGDRTGKPLNLTLRIDGVDTPLGNEELLALVPDFALDGVSADLFGGQQLGSYDLPFAEIDANLLAIEQDDFAAAIIGNRSPEVDGPAGLRSLAIAYGFLESELVGRPLEIEALLRGDASPYQAEIDKAADAGAVS